MSYNIIVAQHSVATSLIIHTVTVNVLQTRSHEPCGGDTCRI